MSDLTVQRSSYVLPSAMRLRTKSKDPSANDKSSITAPGTRTMKVAKGRGLPPPPTIHPHHPRNAKRSQRAK